MLPIIKNIFFKKFFENKNPKIETDNIGVKLGSCGINLEIVKNKSKNKNKLKLFLFVELILNILKIL